MKKFWHWTRISAAAMVVVCVCGLLAIWIVPRSVWAVVLPSALLVEPTDGVTQTPGAAAALPTNTVDAVAQAPAATPTLRAALPPARTPTQGAPSPTPRAPQPTPTLRLTGETPSPTETPAAAETPTQAPKTAETLAEPPARTPTPTESPTESPTPAETPSEAPTPTETATEPPTPTGAPAGSPTLTETPTPAESPTGVPSSTETPTPTETPTATSTPTVTPTETPTGIPTPTLISTQPEVQRMYVCGYERCRDADEYGELIFETEIEVWASSDPNDDRILYTVSHDQEVQLVGQERVWEGPGGLWIEIEGGGWMSEFWLTAERCTPANLESYSFTDCLLGEY